MNEIVHALDRNLDREIETRRSLLELVELEGRTIQAGDHEELDHTLAQIRETLAGLTPIEEERSELLERIAAVLGSDAQIATLTEIAHAVGGDAGSDLLAKRDELRRILRETLARNRQNQYLLRFASGMVSETIDMLMAGPAPAAKKTYGPTGSTGNPDRQGALFRARV